MPTEFASHLPGEILVAKEDFGFQEPSMLSQLINVSYKKLVAVKDLRQIIDVQAGNMPMENALNLSRKELVAQEIHGFQLPSTILLLADVITKKLGAASIPRLTLDVQAGIMPMENASHLQQKILVVKEDGG